MCRIGLQMRYNLLNIIVKHCSEWLAAVPFVEVNISSGKTSAVMYEAESVRVMRGYQNALYLKPYFRMFKGSSGVSASLLYLLQIMYVLPNC